ncbi:MAG TPA: glycosyltransferase family 4 protein [Syntrophorhabdaceae bacterium]|nr:glycosyltransferase family 4 protein [Syntrophorhabdaceae bacterium]HQM80933.1 glycosyltransferase family 4 protein [Syntrophorhabdaceae bacterium]
MKLVYAIRHVGMTGGVKVFFQHVELLRKMGHRVHLITRFIDEEWGFRVAPEVVPSFSDESVPEADGIVVTTPKDVRDLWQVARKRKIPLFHFMQGFEPDYVLERIRGEVVPEFFRSKDVLTRVKYAKKIFGWKRKLRRFDRLYRLPTIKIAISPHLVEGVEKRYGMQCSLLPNGIDRSVFFPKPGELDYSGTLKLLSVGNSTLEYKAIPDILNAVKILKDQGEDVYLTRVSPADIPDAERRNVAVDRFLVKVSENEMADLYRESHILIAASTEIEGFGLPPVEAMSTGTPVILTRISPFLAFDEVHDYAHFVNVHRPDKIAEGILEIAGNKRLRNSLVRRGFQVSDKYSIEAIGKRLEDILKKHIERNRSE